MADDPHKPAGRTFTRPGAPAALTEAQRRAQEHYSGAAEFVARKGEWVTCEAGHRICRLAKDLRYGDMWGSDTFTDWKQPEPVAGRDTQAKCQAQGCEALFYDNTKGLHFGGGWR